MSERYLCLLLPLLLLFKVGGINCFLIQSGKVDRFTCDKNSSAQLDKGKCQCTPAEDTFYGVSDNVLCSAYKGNQSHNILKEEGCTQASSVTNNTTQRIAIECDKASIHTIKTRDSTSNTTWNWKDNWNNTLQKDIKMQPNGQIEVNNTGGVLNGLLLRIEYNCQSSPRCLLVKIYGEREYPISWDKKSATTTTKIKENKTFTSSWLPVIIGIVASTIASAIFVVLLAYIVCTRRNKSKQAGNPKIQTTETQQSIYDAPVRIGEQNANDSEYQIFKEMVKERDADTSFKYKEIDTSVEYKEVLPDYEYPTQDTNDILVNREYKVLETEDTAQQPIYANNSMAIAQSAGKPHVTKKPILPTEKMLQDRAVNPPTFTTFASQLEEGDDTYDTVADSTVEHQQDLRDLYARVIK